MIDFARPRALRATMRAATLALVLATLAACSSAGGGGGTTQEPAPQGGAAGTATTQNAAWPIKTREHVDLWLHGFAMLTTDSAHVPFFRRGYRDQMVVLKNRANVTTLLDANRDKLRARFAANPALATQGQFIAQYFDNWQTFKQFADYFQQAQGNPQAARDPQMAAVIALFAQTFPNAADRDWLRLFIQCLDDEAQKYYHSYWINEQQRRAPALATLDSSWQRVHWPRLQGFLNNTQQKAGDFLVSLPLDGEGRTARTLGPTGTANGTLVVAVSYPETPATANETIYAFVHEAAGQLAASVISDNTTPAEQRAGVADRLSSAAAVRTGYLVLQRVDPSLAPGYADYYLRAAGASRGGATEAQLAAAFPLPDAIAAAITRQLDVVLGGI